MRHRFLISLLAVAAALASVTPPLAAQSGAMSRDPAGLSGLTGLIHVPTAGAIPIGMADITWDNLIAHRFGEHVSYQRNVFVSLGFLPRLTVAARGIVVRDSTRLNPKIVGGDLKRDLSLSAQFLLLDEMGRRPAVAIGVIDPETGGKATQFTTYFVTASKSLFGVSRLTAGYGWGRQAVVDGPFGGLELQVGRWATAIGEYDGERWNAGFRLFPLATFADGLGVQPRVDVIEREGEGRSYGLGMRIALGGPARSGPPTSRDGNPARLAGAPLEAPWAAHRVTTDLVGMGFENVYATVERGSGGDTLVVEYENRRFSHSEWDALGIVMGVASRSAQESVIRIRVTIRRVDLPVLSVSSDLEAFRAFVEGALPDREFAEQLRVERPGPDMDRRRGDVQNPSALKLDVFLRPGLQTTLLTEFGVADARLWFVPDMYLSLGHGFVLNGRVAADVGQSDGFFTPLFEDMSGRLLLHKGMRLDTGSPTVDALTQFSVGMFREDEIGVANQLDVTLREGRVSLGSTLAAFGPELGKIDSGVALGNVRVRYPEWNLTARLDVGIFRRGDGGAAVELSRFFGASEIGFFSKFTNFGSVAGIRVSVPLAPARELRPSYLRPRLPDVFTHAKQITILESPGVIRPYLGLGLETEHELERVYRDRDRIHAVSLRANVRALRAAVLRWLES
jgi:hypothetical protein